MDIQQPLAEAVIRFDRWMTDCALPLWSSNGQDAVTVFAERLDFAGLPVETGFRRLRVLARQTAVFNKVAGKHDRRYDRLAGDAWAALSGLAWIPAWGWAARLGPGGEVIDRQLDLYDQAFGLFALSCRMEATGETALLQWALECLRLIDLHFRGDEGPGWYSVSGLPERDQNPHMHYLEALLHLHAQAPHAEIADRIREILGLLGTHLMTAECGAVLEYFTADWSADDRRGVHFEPGHQFEWYSLTRIAERQGFEVPARASDLFELGHRFGLSAPHNLYWDACDRAGRVTAAQFRVWPQCEAIKAHALHPDLASPAHQVRLAAVIAAMVANFLDPVSDGLWLDRFDEAGAPLVDHVPASTLYHLCEAWLSLQNLR